jgi:LPS O-antigen subunit length determinant protein (WzzB/FepE family)
MLAAARIVWRRRRIVALVTLTSALIGTAYALLAPPVFVSRAIIYPKEISATSEKSVLGVGLGGVLNPLAGISHLNRVGVVVNSPELAATVLKREGMLPLLFPDWWDSSAKRWKEGAPTELDGQEALRKAVFTKIDSYKLTLEISVRARDAGTAYRIQKEYLERLNDRLKEAVIRDAEANREYLERQLSKTYDPWIREKIQELILRQVETGMLLNANAFEVLEGPTYPKLRESPVRKRIVLTWAAVGFVLSCMGILGAASLRGAAPRRR